MHCYMHCGSNLGVAKWVNPPSWPVQLASFVGLSRSFKLASYSWLAPLNLLKKWGGHGAGWGSPLNSFFFIFLDLFHPFEFILVVGFILTDFLYFAIKYDV